MLEHCGHGSAGADTKAVFGDVVGLNETEIAQRFDDGVVQGPDYTVGRAV